MNVFIFAVHAVNNLHIYTLAVFFNLHCGFNFYVSKLNLSINQDTSRHFVNVRVNFEIMNGLV